MQKLFSIILSSLLIFSLCITAFSYEIPKNIRVGLFFGSTSKPQYAISSQSGVSIYGGGGTYITEDAAAKELTVKKDTFYHVCVQKNIELVDDAFALANELKAGGHSAYFALDGKNFSVFSGSFVAEEDALIKKDELCALGYSAELALPSPFGVLVFLNDEIWTASASSGIRIVPNEETISINEKEYRGLLEFFRDSNSDMAAVNVVNLEDYLKGVVPKEASPSWNIEALKAQAVVARTYAIKNINKFSSYGINVDDTTLTQVYGGVLAEYDSTNVAVEETEGEIVMYNGSPAEVFFFSSSGGKTESVENVWGSTGFPYLVSVDDPYENPNEASYANWEIRLSADDVKNKLSSIGIDIGDVTDIKTLEFTPAGRSLKTVIYGTNGEHVLTLEKSRGFFGLYSNSFTISREGSESPSLFVMSENGNILSAMGKLWHIANGNISPLDYPAHVIGADGTKTYSETNSTGDFIFTGKGWGHAIGMSQWGAKGMADNGFSHKEIVTHYFPGTTIEKIG